MNKLAIPFLVISLLAGTVTEAQAQDASTDEKLGTLEKELARELEQSETLKRKLEEIARETANLRAQLVESAKAVQAHERLIADLETELFALEVEEVRKVDELALQKEQFSSVLMALERLARLPPEALFAQPGKPVDTVRSALLLRTIIPEIEHRAETLRKQVASLARAREQIALRRGRLKDEQGNLASESQKLGRLLAQKKLLKQQTTSENKAVEKRAKQLALEASSLRDLVARLEEEKKNRRAVLNDSTLAAVVPPVKPKPPSANQLGSDEPDQAAVTVALTTGTLKGGSIEDSKGKLPYPVVGNLVSGYGDINENGVGQRGVRFSTRASAQVVATFEGKVAFVGDFRGYGQLLIIEHSDGYHSLLAGMSRIDSAIGQEILTGEPVGIMGNNVDAEPVLYMELRRNGQSINPLPWLNRGSSRQQG